jgi:hypothetical protein
MINNGGPLVIPAGGYLVLGNNADSGTNGGVSVDYAYDSSWFLSNGDDEIILLDTFSTEIDRVEYDGGPTFPDPTGASMALSDPALDNNIGANWCTSSTPFGDGDLGTPGATNDCGEPQFGSISGLKFNDIDGDGVKDAGEPGLPGWTIRLIDEAGNVIAETTTDQNGEYGFGSLGAGTYHVSEAQQLGWTQTFPPGGIHSMPLAAGENVRGVDFGNTEGGEPPVEVGGDVFPANRLALLAPWLALAAVLIIGTTIAVRRRRTS